MQSNNSAFSILNSQLLIGVVGCTGTGKTALGVAICKAFGGEVVSCDSMQIYAGMPIATAQPSEFERDGIVHHLMGFLPPEEPYNVSLYCNDAHAAIAGIAARSRIPVVVGGTGLYYSALTQNLQFALQELDTQLRDKLLEETEADEGAAILDKLRAVDPLAAERLQTGGVRRIARAWERYLSTGMTPSEHDEQSRKSGTPYRTLTIGLDFRDREKLYERLDSRVDHMLKAGLREEAERFMDCQSHTARQAIGHKELFPALRGEISFKEAVENLKRNTRRYAKRQRTWFRGQVPDVHWLYIDEYINSQCTIHSAQLLGDAMEVISKFLGERNE